MASTDKQPEESDEIRRRLRNLPRISAGPDFERRLHARLKENPSQRKESVLFRIFPRRLPHLAYSVLGLVAVGVITYYLLLPPEMSRQNGTRQSSSDEENLDDSSRRKNEYRKVPTAESEQLHRPAEPIGSAAPQSGKGGGSVSTARKQRKDEPAGKSDERSTDATRSLRDAADQNAFDSKKIMEPPAPANQTMMKQKALPRSAVSEMSAPLEQGANAIDSVTKRDSIRIDSLHHRDSLRLMQKNHPKKRRPI